MGNAVSKVNTVWVFFVFSTHSIIKIEVMMMSLMDTYSHDEKCAVIAFLHAVISEDRLISYEELNIVWMLAKSIKLDLLDVQNLSEESFQEIISNLSDEKLIEVLRMAYSLMSMDQTHEHKETKILDFVRSLKPMDDISYRRFYVSMNKMSDLTPLDQVILIVLANHVAEVDGRITEEEGKMIVALCTIVGVDPHEMILYKIPKDALYHAVFSMSKHAVKRIVEELLLVAIADFKISEQEYEFILPIISHFHLDFEELLQSARSRFQEHLEYYELFRTVSEIN